MIKLQNVRHITTNYADDLSYIDTNPPIAVRVTFDITKDDLEYIDGHADTYDDVFRVFFSCPSVKRLVKENLRIKKVIYNDPATIVFWKDGTKTVAKCHGEEFDKEKGLFAAIAKKVYAENGNLPRSVAKYLK